MTAHNMATTQVECGKFISVVVPSESRPRPPSMNTSAIVMRNAINSPDIASGKDWESAREHLSNFIDGKNPVGGKQAFKDSRQRLPGEATVLALVDGPYYIEKMAEFMGPVLKAQGMPVNIPPMKATKGKSFFGMAVTLQPERGSYDLWLPASAVIEIRKMLPQLGGGDVGAR